ncbi:MAG: preprotein translocase subunit SecG [Lachnospiraceae bacterium]|nr:preprotein translocase subunit SecG [Lachnospiraceae bacterium]
METLLTVLYIIDCLALTVIVLMQQGKSAGLTGTISGAAETYWGKNKARSMEGKLEKATVVLAILFIVLSLALSYVIK